MQEPQLTLQDFDFQVPEELVAQQPLSQRDASRLIIRQNSGAIKHSNIRDLTSELPSGALLIFNDSRVIPSRLFGNLPTGGRVELFLLAPESVNIWQAMGRPLKKLHEGSTVELPGNISAEVMSKTTTADGNAFVSLRLHGLDGTVEDWLDRHGHVPLPPYIKRADQQPARESSDRERYQTVYANDRGSVAAPTAGLHFSPELLTDLKRRGIETAKVCLHVGAGTFLPVKSEIVETHRMHSERFQVPQSTLKAISKAQLENRPIIPVGTTSLRSLESLMREATKRGVDIETLADTWLTTDLFIHPRKSTDTYKPWAATGLLTNFHQPCSTLFMLICALIGYQNAKRLYAEAVEARYRFFSYGDACLLWL